MADQPHLPVAVPRAAFTVPARASELFPTALAILASLLLVIFSTGAGVAFHRWLWLDEICTLLIAREPPAHALELLKHAVDSNLPGLYIILGGLHALGMPLTEVPLRVVTVSAMWLALVGLYANLRVVYPRLPSLVATAALLTAGILFRHTFEVRFYAIWLALLMWEAYFLARARTLPPFSWQHFILIPLTALVLLIHYYGVVTLFLMLTADFLADTRPFSQKLRSRWPVIIGLLVLPVIPYFYFSQRSVLSAGTWLDPPTIRTSLTFFRDTLLLYPILVLALLLIASKILLPARSPVPLSPPPSSTRFPLAGLTALAFFPVFLVIFSWLMQPTLYIRYGVPGLAGAAVLAAALANRLPRAVAAGALLLACAAIFLQFHKIRGESAAFQQSLDRDLTAIVQTHLDAPILFETPHELYPTVLYHPELQSRSYVLLADTAHEDPAVLPFAPHFLAFVGLAHARVEQNFPAFQSISRAQLPFPSKFFLITAQRGEFAASIQRLEARFPGYQAASISPGAYWLQLSGAASTPASMPIR